MIGGPPSGAHQGGAVAGPPGAMAGGKGGKPTSTGPTKPGESAAGSAAVLAGGAVAPRDLAAFARQFNFAFRVPETLPGGWRLAHAAPAGKARVLLSYTAGSRTMTVRLSASPGPKTTPAAVQVQGQSLVAARRGGVLVAFDREAVPESLWDEVVQSFAADSDSP